MHDLLLTNVYTPNLAFDCKEIPLHLPDYNRSRQKKADKHTGLNLEISKCVLNIRRL